MERSRVVAHPNERIRQERLRHNWRQREVADLLGTTVVTVNRWERGIQQPSAYFRVRLCALFGKSEEELGIFPEELLFAEEADTSSAKSKKEELVHLSEELVPFVSEETDTSPYEVSSSTEMPDSADPFMDSSFLPQPIPLTAPQQQNRGRMLRRLHYSYRTLLAQSLQGAAWIDLGLAQKPDAVRNMTTLLLRSAHQPERILPPETSIVQVYEDAAHELLILGEPGTGKSLLLLTLAQELVIHAERKSSLPLPVILPLSSWAVKRPALEDWIAEQLTQLYDVPTYLAREWMQRGDILPLLDGLDEMETEARPVCIMAINTYHQTHLTPLVVCSRTREYDLAAEQQRLTLHQAVVVQPLVTQQVKMYLEIAGKPFAALRQVLKENVALQELVTTPLMLNVVLLAYRGTPVHNLPTVSDQLERQVWTDYIERMVIRKGDEKRYPLQQTCSWLAWLAHQMRGHNQTVFYLEHLQPDWLTDRYQRVYTWLGVRLPSIFIGGLVCILLQLLYFHATDRRDVVLFGVIGGLLGGLLSLSPTNAGRSQRPRWRTQLALSFFVGLMIGINEGWGIDTTLQTSIAGGLILGATFGLSSLLLQQVLLGPRLPLSFMVRLIARRWIPSLALGRWVARAQAIQRWHPEEVLWVIVLFGLSYALSNKLHVGLNTKMDGLSIGLSIGLTSIMVRAILERHASGISPTERLTWTWQSVKNGLFSLRHLRLCLILVGCIIIPVGLGYGLSYGLSGGLNIGISYGVSEGLSDGLSVGLGHWLLMGLYQSITQGQMENKDRRLANEGIRRSVHNSILMGLLSGCIIAGIMILSYGLRGGIYYGLQGNLYYGLSTGLNNGIHLLPSLTVVSILLVGMISGGLATWQHYLIRYLLAHIHIFPWRAPHFLDDATARILLRHVGGGYTFTHRLLLDHLADTVSAYFQLTAST